MKAHSPLRKPRRSSLTGLRKVSADDVVAATAGEDNWKTWAGRSTGSDDFEWFDLLRGAKRTLQQFSTPSRGTACPVCLCEPEEEDWYVTSSCSHAVCLDCFQAYAKSQVLDREQSGPLKCPVCPQVLRRKDATIALGGDRELIRQWDVKIRNQLLRALPAFRACPHCNDSGGGGFVTPSCLSPHYQERRDNAFRQFEKVKKLQQRAMATFAGLFLFIVRYRSRSMAVDLFFVLALLYIGLQTVLTRLVQIAEGALEALFQPVSVDCPGCESSFILPAETKQFVDEESARWIGSHTRPCPSCSVPISKTGGCNHMKCSHCRASFCWACMRLRSNCAAYHCRNGAPFKNAIPGVSDIAGPLEPSEEDSILGRADEIMQLQRRLSFLPQIRNEISLAALLLALFGRDLWPIQGVATLMWKVSSTIHAAGFVAWMVVGLSSWLVWSQWPRRARQAKTPSSLPNPAPARRHSLPHGRQRRPTRRRHSAVGNSTASEFLLGADVKNERQRERNFMGNLEKEKKRRRQRHVPLLFMSKEEKLKHVLKRSLD